jgi:hypothetical protein
MISSRYADVKKNSGFDSITIKGSKAGMKPDEFQIPYKGGYLSGDAARKQCEDWAKTGVIEYDTAQAITKVLDRPDWYDLSDCVFVLLGAGSAMGPFELLLELGANIICIDLEGKFSPRAKANWQRLIRLARESRGTITIPIPKGSDPKKGDDFDENLAQVAGCNLLTQTPEIALWLIEQHDTSRPFIIGAYAYLDGPMFVKVSVAMDAIIDVVCRSVGAGGVAQAIFGGDIKKPAIAYLCTPTDTHIVPYGAVAAAARNWNARPLWQHLMAVPMMAVGHPLARNTMRKVEAENGDEFYVVDAIVNQQGPNYLLAKRLQHWRAIIERENGSTVSSSIAPSTATVSVTSNKLFAMAYEGLPHFKPHEVYKQESSTAVMGALLISDIRDVTSASHKSTPLKNPLQLFSKTSFHGGAWRVLFHIELHFDYKAFVIFQSACGQIYFSTVNLNCNLFFLENSAVSSTARFLLPRFCCTCS